MRARTRQRAVKRVVVRGRDGVELVIVAARTGNGKPLKGFSKSVDLIVHDVRAYLPETNAIVVAQFSQAQKRRSNDRLVDPFLGVDPRLWEQIAGKMFANELVVRNVLIECADQVVTIKPGAFDFVVPVVAESFGETHDVHPVASPTFAEMR